MLGGRLKRERKQLERDKEVRKEENKMSRLNKGNVIDLWKKNYGNKMNLTKWSVARQCPFCLMEIEKVRS